MKFILNEYHRNVTDEELLADMKRVAIHTNKDTLTIEEYKKHGKFCHSTFRRHFGGWNKAILLCGLNLNETQKVATQGNHQHKDICDEDLFGDIKRVASQLGKETISSGEYNKYGTFSKDTCFRRFGTWENTLSKAGIKPYILNSEKRIQDDELLEEIERLWIALGRQPTTTDIKNGLSRYTLNTFSRHFGGWRKALETFVDWVNQERNELPDANILSCTCNSIEKEVPKMIHTTIRDINLRLRFKVMQRDSFKCCLCGASPAKDPSIILHVDHILPWAKGGETVFDNLQTLCSKCNLGKSDMEME